MRCGYCPGTGCWGPPGVFRRDRWGGGGGGGDGFWSGSWVRPGLLLFSWGRLAPGSGNLLLAPARWLCPWDNVGREHGDSSVRTHRWEYCISSDMVQAFAKIILSPSPQPQKSLHSFRLSFRYFQNPEFISVTSQLLPWSPSYPSAPDQSVLPAWCPQLPPEPHLPGCEQESPGLSPLKPVCSQVTHWRPATRVLCLLLMGINDQGEIEKLISGRWLQVPFVILPTTPSVTSGF